MGILSIIKQWLITPTRIRPVSAHPDLRPLDIQSIGKELQLEAKAKDQGLSDLPSQDSKLLSGPENHIVQKIEKYRHDCITWAGIRLGVINEDLSKINLDQEANQFSQMEVEFSRDSNQILADNKLQLLRLFEKAQSTKRELDRFKELHKLDRDADYREGSAKTLAYAVLVLLVVLEGIFNAAFFAQGGENGLMGGFGIAVICAATNVVISFAIGNFIRLRNHSEGLKSFLGHLFIVIAILITSLIALSIAHYRDALVANMADPAESALIAMKLSPFVLHDITSWGLAGLTVVFGVVAVLDGYLMDDPYPGFGKATRNWKTAAEDYDNAEITVKAELDELKDSKLKDLELLLTKIQTKINVFDGLIEDKKTTKFKLTGALESAGFGLEALLKIFRDENEKHRTTRPPEYFNVSPKLKSLKAPSFDTRSEKAKSRKLHSIYQVLLDSLPDLQGKIQKAYEENYSHAPINSILKNSEA